MVSTPKMNPINCRNGKIVAAFEVTENETVLDSKNTWDLRPISPSDLETTAIEEQEREKLKGIDLLAGFSSSLAPTRKWLFFQDIFMLERLSRDILNDNYTNICDGIHLYMANNAFALMRSCFVDGGEWNAYAIRLPARNGEDFFWIKGAPKLIKEDRRYQMIRWIGLAAEFETSIEREEKYGEAWKSKMTGKRKTLLLVKRDLGNGCEILINQEYDHLRVNKMKNYADIIEIKTWKEGEEEALREINKSSFYSVSKLFDLDVVVLWNKKVFEKYGLWKKCLVESTKKYQIAPEKLTPKNKERLNEGNAAIRQLVKELHQSTAEVIYFTIKNKKFEPNRSTLEKFVADLEGESEIGNYVKSTIDELKRHHQNAEIRPVDNSDEVITSMNEHRFDNVLYQTPNSYASAVNKGKETNEKVPGKKVDQLTVKNEPKTKNQLKGESELDQQNAVILVEASRAASNGIVNGSSNNGRIATRPTSYAEAAKKQKAIHKNITPSEEKKTFDVDENNFPLLGATSLERNIRKSKNQESSKLRFRK